MLLSTFWVLTVRKHTNMNASIYITDLCPWAGKFLYFSFCLLHILLANILFHTYLQNCFLHNISLDHRFHTPHHCVAPNLHKTKSAQTHQDEVSFIIFFFRSSPSSSLLLKVKRTSFQPRCVGRRPGREWRPFLSAGVPRRIALCLNSPACHHKKDAYGWLPFFHTALAEGEYFFSLTYK